MSHTRQSPAMHIARKHQSAPQTHWADKEIQKAAVEIDEGRYVADPSMENAADQLGLALGTGTGRVAMGEKLTFEDFQREAIATRDMNELGKHPRVVEALERLKLECDQAKTPDEQLEKMWAMRELNQASAEGSKWEGQERWEGRENEEMRKGQLLTPIQFHEKLCSVIGRERILLSHHAVKTHPDAKSGRVGLYIKNVHWTGDQVVKKEYVAAQSDKLRTEGTAEMVKGKRYRLAGMNALADKAMNKAAEMAEQATRLLMEQSAQEQIEPEFLRVGTLQWPLGTEWMIMAFDEYGVPTQAKFLGWRTALLTMIRAGCLTEEEAQLAFPVGSSPASSWYLEQLYMRRNQTAVVQ